MPNRLLPRRRDVDVVQRQGDFDEFLGGFDGVAGHQTCFMRKCLIVVAYGSHWVA